MLKLISILCLGMLSTNAFAGEGMTQKYMESIVKEMAIKSTGSKGYVEFTYNTVQMYLISDVKHNRMRIITPIQEYKKLSVEQIDAIMEANFHAALDARYAVSKGILYSAFIHPLSDLNELQLQAGIKQVSNLFLTFGTQYSSGTLKYGG